uniref:Uncharacterized protein n=1 Tax=Myoviridae sp. ctZgq1 TaxID=2826666 RepID=A0A8S5LXH3_9CAUD|nr:MAG TPA: hypothetical protein [Myoviridae sp. ctZgq1]
MLRLSNKCLLLCSCYKAYQINVLYPQFIICPCMLILKLPYVIYPKNH